MKIIVGVIFSILLFTINQMVYADKQSDQALELAQNGIVGTNASGDPQTTVVDEYGNLKMVPSDQIKSKPTPKSNKSGNGAGTNPNANNDMMPMSPPPHEASPDQQGMMGPPPPPTGTQGPQSDQGAMESPLPGQSPGDAGMAPPSGMQPGQSPGDAGGMAPPPLPSGAQGQPGSPGMMPPPSGMQDQPNGGMAPPAMQDAQSGQGVMR